MTEEKQRAPRQLQVVESVEALAHSAAEEFVLRAADAIQARGRFIVALSGGSTPKSLFQLLSTSDFASRVSWPQVHVFWGDERCVAPDDERSNYRMACTALLDHVPIPEANVHRMRGEDAPEVAAAEYEATVRELFGAPINSTDDFASFDLILLGLGTDGHTASLFPAGAAVHEQTRWVVADYGEAVAMWRITFTLPLINAARRVLFLVAGADKANVVREILSASPTRESYPAALVAPTHGVAHWIIDRAAYSAAGSM